MASHRRLRSKTASNRISQLPEDVKHRILECLTTREAARTALLSTQWRDVWLRHDQLVFDWRLGEDVDEECSILVEMITGVLLLRSGPVKKFTLQTFFEESTPYKSDLDLWCLFLSRNGIQNLQLFIEHNEDVAEKYTLPFCLIACPTIKNLELDYVDFCFPVNARLGNIFPGVTSLIFTNVRFMPNATGILLKIPNLEELVFHECEDIDNFVVSAPKLKSLTFTNCSTIIESKWFELHFPVIKTLHFSASWFGWLLRMDDPSILENSDSWFKDQDLCELKTVKIKAFTGLSGEMLLIKKILSKSPALEEVVIKELSNYRIGGPEPLKMTREMIRFPRASPKAQVIFLNN
ncbi:unnamed protein product [Cuscuta europaea]|uniref:F-box domain-containing protein n=1 Tax=Cuscuta europaea TaxID=41803 RepID=A0A9P1EG87_CUSEU|nr:unnamed protein product [Cuscuta europaea]